MAVAEEAQVCFPTKDGWFTLCNYVVRGGVIIKSKSGKWLKIPRLFRKLKKKEDEAKGRTQETETASPVKENADPKRN